MTVATGNFAELLWPGIASIWGRDYNDYGPLYTQFFSVKNSEKAFEKEQGVTGLPLAGVKDQGSPIPFLDPFQGFQKEYINLTYGLGSSVTREMYEDDQYNYINQIPSMLARSMRQTEEVIATNILNNSFTSTAQSADGASIVNSSHSLIGGGTMSNTPTVAADLTMASLEQACVDIMNFVDDQGLTIMVRPTKLIVPTASWAIAEKILGTDRAVGSNDNDVNVVRNKVSLIVSPYITDSDSWFIVTDVPNGLTFYNRRAAEINRDNDFETQNLKFSTTRRFSVGCTDYRGVYGTAGA